MDGIFPNNQWQPLSRAGVMRLFDGAPFAWGLAGGYAVEQFVGTSLRAHSDTDILVFRDQQLHVQCWLPEWRLYAADPPGTLRPWADGEFLPYGIHDIWGHRRDVQAWQLQIMLTETDGDHWFMRRNPEIRGVRDDLIVVYGGIPCVRIEVQLLFKSRSNRLRDSIDFQACLPHLSGDAKRWLRENLLRLYPAGHVWMLAREWMG